MRRESIINSLECKYTPEEMAEIAKNLSGNVAELESVAAEKKVSDATYNGRIKKIEEEIGTLAKSYNRGYEMRDITCDICYDDPAPGQKSIYRVDTKELVATKEMTFEEKQTELQFNLPQSSEPSPEQIDEALGKMQTAGEIPPEPAIVDPPPSDVQSENPPEAA
jgi:hypothetical protein